MLVLDIEKLVPNIFLEDLRINGRNTCISQLTILTIKSLLPMEEAVGNEIDYQRFDEEIKLWKEYCIGDNSILVHSLKGSNNDNYNNFYDENYYTRLIPILVANSDLSIYEEELIKNILYFSGDVRNLLEWTLIGVGIYLLINGEGDLVSSLKDYIINFSQIDFLAKYKDYFPTGIGKISSRVKIGFEKERIVVLNVLNGIKSDRYPFLQDLLSLVEGGEATTPLGRLLYNSNKDTNIDMVDPFHTNMNSYLIKLRKGRINLEDLEIKEYVLPDVFSFKEGEVFFHSLLNRSKVLKKEVKQGVLTSLITTKSGNYLFKRDPSS